MQLAAEPITIAGNPHFTPEKDSNKSLTIDMTIFAGDTYRFTLITYLLGWIFEMASCSITPLGQKVQLLPKLKHYGYFNS